MTNFKKSMLIAVCLTVLLVTGCEEYISHQIYKIKTVDGQVIKLSCPTIDRERNIFTYAYNGRCVIVAN